jgi:hypothetical protein
MMNLTWLIAANLGLWTQAFKHKKIANFLHYLCMSIVVIITWMSGILAIVTFWNQLVTTMPFHFGLGLTIMIVVALQAIVGILCWLMQKGAKIRPDIVHNINIIHRVLGWIMFTLTLIQILVVQSFKQ